MGQSYGTNSKGGYLATEWLSKELNKQVYGSMVARQIVSPVKGYGSRKGGTLDFDIYTNVATGGGDLTENVKIPMDEISIIQAQLTVTEKGNAIPFTRKLEELGEIGIREPIRDKLSDDAKNVLDNNVITQLKAGQLIYTPTGTVGSESYTLATGGTATATATARGFQTFDLYAIGEEMNQVYHIPKFDGKMYGCLCSQSAIANLQADSSFRGWAEAAKYVKPNADQLMTGELNQLGGMRFIVDTQNMAQYIPNNAGTANAAAGKGDMVFFGEKPCHEAIVQQIQVLYDDEDFARLKKLAWYYLGGFKNIWAAQNTAGLVRTIKVASDV